MSSAASTAIPAPVPSTIDTTVCIVGGGPAGIMLSLLLARAGVRVAVCEKHPDFNRDFRGDTIHPATLQIMHDLGLLDRLLQLPHQNIQAVGAVLGGTEYGIADFTHLPVAAPQIALMPQWDLLNFLADELRHHPNAQLLLQHKVTGLSSDNGRITGVSADAPKGPVHLRASLTVGCDGRHSITTEAALLEHVETGSPIDVLWFRLARRPSDPDEGLGFLNLGRMVVLINRADYFQCGYIVRKGAFNETIQPAGLARFRDDLAELVPFLAEPGDNGLPRRVDELTSFDQLKLLTVQVNHLRRWHRPGLLCIGDAAHTMSPVGGIGINLAIQDAVATANLLAGPLLAAQAGVQANTLPTQAALRAIDRAAARVQRRRELPTRITQGLQVLVHRFLNRFLGRPGTFHAPLLIRLLARFPRLRRLPGRFIGMGVLPEHPRLPTRPRLPAPPARTSVPRPDTSVPSPRALPSV